MTEYKTIAETNRFIVLDRYIKDWKLNESYQSEDALERELVTDLEDLGYTFERELNRRKNFWRMCASGCKR